MIPVLTFLYLVLFTLSQSFPCDLLNPTYTDANGKFKAQTELKRSQEYIKKIHDCEQLPEQHILLQMIETCLLNLPEKQLCARDILQLIKQARAEVKNELVNLSKLELIQTLYA